MRANRTLLHKIESLNENPKANNTSTMQTFYQRQLPKKSLNMHARLRQANSIQEENQKMVKRLLAMTPNYNMLQYEKEFESMMYTPATPAAPGSRRTGSKLSQRPQTFQRRHKS